MNVKACQSVGQSIGQKQDCDKNSYTVAGYEIQAVNSDAKVIRSSVQQSVHFDKRRNMPFIDIINLRVYDNRTVEIIDTRGRPPFQDFEHQHVSECVLGTGMPGGSFSVFS